MSCPSPAPGPEEPEYQHGQEEVAKRIHEGRASCLATWAQGTTATATALHRHSDDGDVQCGLTSIMADCRQIMWRHSPRYGCRCESVFKKVS